MTPLVDVSEHAQPLSARLLSPALPAVAVFLAYVPTIISLAKGPWQTEQEGHGPLIIAASLWLVWHERSMLRRVRIAPAPFLGWLALLSGLILLVLSRIQDVLTTEALSMIPVAIGIVLLLAGWPALRALAFPIGLLLFAVPAPDWMIDGLTVPLKVFISDAVTQLLYTLGYPVAQNGVMIMIGSYQLLVKDACSGLNSIFALSAIGLFYVYTFRRNSKLRAALLLAGIIPITILANFLRVLGLVLTAYYGGVGLVDGILHDVTGIALFAVALVLLFLLDGILALGEKMGRIWRPEFPAAKAR